YSSISLFLSPLYTSLSLFLFFYRSAAHRDLHSFPTRRSSDLFAALRDNLPDPISHARRTAAPAHPERPAGDPGADTHQGPAGGADRKSTRLNSSHDQISYAVFCLKKKKKKKHKNKSPRNTKTD